MKNVLELWAMLRQGKEDFKVMLPRIKKRILDDSQIEKLECS
jgi:hypothetical protein